MPERNDVCVQRIRRHIQTKYNKMNVGNVMGVGEKAREDLASAYEKISHPHTKRFRIRIRKDWRAPGYSRLVVLPPGAFALSALLGVINVLGMLKKGGPDLCTIYPGKTDIRCTSP